MSGPDGQRSRVVLVPDFASTSTIVLVNVESLEVTPMNFSAWS
jgi:hypothetical protein